MPFVIKSAPAEGASPRPSQSINPPPRSRIAHSSIEPALERVKQTNTEQGTPEPYEVGYGRPPRHTQFKKGESGNPKGRPKGAKGLKTIARELLTERVAVKTAAGPKKMTLMEAMFRKMSERAIGGDVRALQALIQHYQASVPDEPVRLNNNAPIKDMDRHDQAIIDAFTATLREASQ